MLKNNQTKLAKNIRDLRYAYGETQEELGFSIGVEKNTISYYESGGRFPKREVLEKIASHYRITVDELLESDFSGIKLTEIFNDETALKEIGKKMFPIITSKEAENDSLFFKAYILHQKLIKEFDEGIIDEAAFEECVSNYEVSIQKNETPEAVANLIGIYIFLVNTVVFDSMSEKYQSVKMKKGDMNTVLKEAWLRNYNDDFEECGETSSDIKEFIDEMQETMLVLIRILKKSRKLEELADYYIALMYLISIINNDQSEETNKLIGNEMLLLQQKINNPYAIQYIEAINKINIFI